MTVKDLIKACSKEDYVCVYDIATDTYLYDSYLCNNQTHDDVDGNLFRCICCIFIGSLVLM